MRRCGPVRSPIFANWLCPAPAAAQRALRSNRTKHKNAAREGRYSHAQDVLYGRWRMRATPLH